MSSSAPDDPAERAPTRSELVDRMIASTINWRRSPKVLRTQREIYRAGDTELSPLQVDVLEMLCVRAKARMGDLSKDLAVDPASLTRAVGKLVALDLVTRSTIGSDRRLVVVSPTPKAKRVISRILASRRRLAETLFGALTDDEFRILVENIERFFSAWDDVDVAPHSLRRYE